MMHSKIKHYTVIISLMSFNLAICSALMTFVKNRVLLKFGLPGISSYMFLYPHFVISFLLRLCLNQAKQYYVVQVPLLLVSTLKSLQLSWAKICTCVLLYMKTTLI